ncbi:MAG: Gfo/Idh/MocA family oxidoreductase [Acidobacteria bacterium]|nr:Gfo/Idh/MocA family oxidoreductase [Acidobacteriota bacterium]
MSAPRVLLVGSGMIAQDQILPSLFQLQRNGVVGEITVVSASGASITALANTPKIRRAFPERSFARLPLDDSGPHNDLFREVIASLPPRQLVVAAVPDQLHYDVVMTALRHDQHVCCVKPLVLNAAQSVEIENEARARGLCVGVEYHKRLDDRSLMARQRYREGLFGTFQLGTACLMEKWYYRHSNFQNWCTVENSDAFTYIGCHYVDLVHFITGLLPRSVSVYGIRDKYPNDNEGFLWTDARVIWENGACLNVQNTLSFPDSAPGPNTQGITMYFAGSGTGAWLEHSDQYRGLRYSYVRNPGGDGATQFAEPSPDYFQYVDLGGKGMTVVGYGYRSVEFIVKQCLRVDSAGDLAARQAVLAQLDREGVLATPANSRYNELVMEAGRMSILNEGREVVIEYGDAAKAIPPGVQFRY